jgi:demethylmenaquinone methyltransferase/2-methoxy-6-polyprenyl-1,4-benzoquinol methylase
VRRLFATIADKYDFITVALSYGQDRRWKRQLIALATSLPGEPVAAGPPLSGRRALDLATGTGDLALELESSGARVVGLDITPRMIELARLKADRRTRTCVFVVGDMLALPFPDRSFDVVTTGYGLRNVTDLSAAIDEMARVLTAGGVALSLDFNRPSNRLICSAYLLYLTVIGSVLGWLLHKDADTYRYIPASIRRYPGADAVARLMEARGFTEVKYVPVLGGLMAIHRGRRSG